MRRARSIRHCQIGVDGGKAIADALLTNQTLQSLGIDGNELGSSQAAISASYKGRFSRDDEDGGKPSPFGKQGSIMRIFYRKSRDEDEDDERKGTLPRTKSTSE